MRKRMTVLETVTLLFLFPFSIVFAQKTEDLLRMDLEDIMGMDVTVFSVRGLTQRQTPGVLTVIEEEEIRRSGARDLVDVLRLVPGFDFGVDVQSAVSLGIRGLWAQEGKVLLLVDGMEMNEIRFSCLALGDHFPVEHVKRLEIIRGPGTSFYGGYAELAVIHIVTKSAVDLSGVEASVSYGRTAQVESRRSLALNFGRKFGPLKLKALTYFGRSVRSDREYTDPYGNAYPMKDNSVIRPDFLNVALDFRGLEAQFVADRYKYDMQDGMGEVIGRTFDNSFDSYSAKIRYPLNIGSDWTLSPQATYLRQEPWKTVDPAALDSAWNWYSRVIAERIKLGYTLRGTIRNDVQVIAGAEGFVDVGSMTELMTEDLYFSGGKRHTANRQAAAFAQAFYTKGNTIPSIGLRYERIEHGTETGSENRYDWRYIAGEFMPWIGITQIMGKWSFKALYGQTFRAPTLENFDMNSRIKPEKTDAVEIEFGFQASENAFLIADFFWTRINGPIVYSYNKITDEEEYGNYGKIGSKGAELEFRWKGSLGYLNTSYSYYAPDDRIDLYSVPGAENFFLGFAKHKASLSGHCRIGRNWSLNPTLSMTGSRHAFIAYDSLGGNRYKEFKPSVMGSLCVQVDRPLGLPVDLSVGVYNAFNVDVPFIQPYDSGHPPLPSLSREFVLNLKYRLKW